MLNKNTSNYSKIKDILKENSICLPVSALGQDHHAFLINEEKVNKEATLLLGGVEIKHRYSCDAESDGDVIIHALCNAISGLSGTPILGFIADDLCRQGIKDSKIYLEKALKTLDNRFLLTHISFCVEAKEPILKKYLLDIRKNIAKLVDLTIDDVTITATTGEGLSGMGKGLGIGVLCQVSALKYYIE